MKRKGWIVWTWGKMGSLLVFFGMLIMMLAAYGATGNTSQADAANQLSQTIKNLLLDTYDSGSEMSFEYAMPQDLNGEGYSVEIMNKSGSTIGIITSIDSGSSSIIGGASLSLPLSGGSFGMLKDFDDELSYICITKYLGNVYLERSKCE